MRINKKESPLLDMLCHRARHFPNKVGYAFPESAYQDTWSQLYQNVRRAACHLYGQGIRKGDVVAVLMEGSPQMIITLFAAAALGAVAMPVNPYATAAEIRKIFLQACPKTLLADTETTHVSILELRRLQAAKEPSEANWFPEKIFLYGPETPEYGFAKPFEALLQPAPENADFRFQLQSVSGADPAFLLFTSGTTGSAKGIWIPLNAIDPAYREKGRLAGRFQKNARNLFDRFASRFKAMSLLPMYHYAGLSLLFTPLRVCPVTLVGLRRFHPAKALQYLQQSRSTILVATPFMVQSLMTVTGFNPQAVDRIKTIIFTSAAVDRTILQRVWAGYRKLRWFLVSYGTSETGGVANGICVLNRQQRHPAGILLSLLSKAKYIRGYIDHSLFLKTAYSIGGKVYRNVAIRIQDKDTGQLLPFEATGEILVQTGHTTRYMQEAETADRFTTDGWFRTGDLGYLDANGLLFIVGRASRMISRGGAKIAPIEVEEAILQFPGVLAAHVLSLPHELYGEQVGAAVVMAPGKPANEPQLKAFLEPLLSKYKIPQYFVFPETLPLTASGKIADEEVKLLFSQNMPAAFAYA